MRKWMCELVSRNSSFFAWGSFTQERTSYQKQLLNSIFWPWSLCLFGNKLWLLHGVTPLFQHQLIYPFMLSWKPLLNLFSPLHTFMKASFETCFFLLCPLLKTYKSDVTCTGQRLTFLLWPLESPLDYLAELILLIITIVVLNKTKVTLHTQVHLHWRAHVLIIWIV